MIIHARRKDANDSLSSFRRESKNYFKILTLGRGLPVEALDEVQVLPRIIRNKRSTLKGTFFIGAGYEKDIFAVLRMNSNSCKNDILLRNMIYGVAV